jgi:hypothetical protein
MEGKLQMKLPDVDAQAEGDRTAEAVVNAS